MKLEGKSVLVTGGTGFIGGRLIEKLILQQSAHVRTLARQFSTATRIARFPVEIVSGNITDGALVQKCVQGCDFVFHCAHDSKLSKESQNQMAVQGTRNLSEAVLREGVSRMVHVSSVAVYGATLEGDLTEISPWMSSNQPYVQAKRAAEQLVLDLYRQKDLPVVVLQPTIVYGPFSKPWTLGPINDLKTGLVPLVNGGEGYCNAVYIDDVVDAMILAAMQPNVLGEIFLISGEKPISWKTFYRAFESALGIHATVDISEEKIKELQKNQAHKTGMTYRLIDWLGDPKFFLLLESTPVASSLLKMFRNRVSEEQRISLKSKMLRIVHGQRQNEAKVSPFKNLSYKENLMDEGSKKSIHVPNETLLALYRARTIVRIDKAKKLLGYKPKFDFERGMDLTSQFIHWANLG